MTKGTDRILRQANEKVWYAARRVHRQSEERMRAFDQENGGLHWISGSVDPAQDLDAARATLEAVEAMYREARYEAGEEVEDIERAIEAARAAAKEEVRKTF